MASEEVVVGRGETELSNELLRRSALMLCSILSATVRSWIRGHAEPCRQGMLGRLPAASRRSRIPILLQMPSGVCLSFFGSFLSRRRVSLCQMCPSRTSPITWAEGASRRILPVCSPLNRSGKRTRDGSKRGGKMVVVLA
jgi:hypothetical protein